LDSGRGDRRERFRRKQPGKNRDGKSQNRPDQSYGKKTENRNKGTKTQTVTKQDGGTKKNLFDVVKGRANHEVQKRSGQT